jgi:hypothetical protein
MPNPVGKEVYAAAGGIVEWSGNGVEAGWGNDLDIYSTYGNVVLIRHDEGYRGQPVWTLYAHLVTTLVNQGDRVVQGQKIGLSGATGDVTGPHVHMEVRLGQNSYFTVLNPLLWIVPYVGHGVVAGRVSYPDGTMIDDVTVTLSQRGRVIETTWTYLSPWEDGARTWHVLPDPAWQENFVMSDIPEGEYQVSVTLPSGQHVTRDITVRASTTNFVLLGVEPAATPQPVE